MTFYLTYTKSEQTLNELCKSATGPFEAYVISNLIFSRHAPAGSYPHRGVPLFRQARQLLLHGETEPHSHLLRLNMQQFLAIESYLGAVNLVGCFSKLMLYSTKNLHKSK
jgi:hypothetical protein